MNAIFSALETSKLKKLIKLKKCKLNFLISSKLKVVPKLNLNVSVLSVFFWVIGAVHEKLKGPICL